MTFRELLPTAIMEGDLETINSLLSLDIDIHWPIDSTINNVTFNITPLCLAAKFGWVQIVETFLCKGAHLETPSDDVEERLEVHVTSDMGPSKITAVNMAALNGHSKVVELLCDAGASPLAVDMYGRNALANAGLHGHLDTVRVLLNYLKDIDSGDYGGQTTALLAAISGNEKLVSLLLEKGATKDQVDYMGCNALWHATVHGHTEVMKVLIQAGCPLRDPTNPKDGLHFVAAAHGVVESLKVLVAAGCSLEDRNSEGQTLLHVAAARNQISVMEHLIEQHVCLDKLDDKCYTPLCHTIEYGNTDAAKILLRAGSNPKFPECPRKTPLVMAIDLHDAEMVKVLVEGGADINQPDLFERSPMMHAIANDSPAAMYEDRRLHQRRNPAADEMAILLMDSGCDLDLQDMEGNTALHLSVMCHRRELVGELLCRGCKVNLTNKAGKTPLHIAVSEGDIESSKQLVLHGCDIHIEDVDHRTPLQCLGKYRVLRLPWGNVHCQQVNNRKMAALCHILVLSGARWPSNSKIHIKHLQDMYLRLLPRTLSQTCRIVIRNSLRPKTTFSVQSLPLPTLLKRYLLFSDL